MSGSVKGGKKAARTNKEKYGESFYKNIGAEGGKAKVAKGFSLNSELARVAGAKGGRISKRGPTNKTVVVTVERPKKNILNKLKGLFA